MIMFECRTCAKILILINVKGKMSLCATFRHIELNVIAAPLIDLHARWM